MRLLLDTHALLWFVMGDSSLSAVARKAIEDVENTRFVSHATAWEIAVKLRLGKLQLNMPYEDLFPKQSPPTTFKSSRQTFLIISNCSRCRCIIAIRLIDC